MQPNKERPQKWPFFIDIGDKFTFNAVIVQFDNAIYILL